MKDLHQQFLTGERALFMAADLHLQDCLFDDGESPLKHSKNIILDGCLFKWKYPLWYSENISMRHCSVFEMGRAGIWYTDHITVTDCVFEAPKNFHRCNGVVLERVSFSNAAETLWQCRDIRMQDVTAKGDYFAMNCSCAEVEGLKLVGNYCFDGASDVTIRSSSLLSKDAFWNCENITIYDSFISGEYFGWNSRNIRLVNCTVESLQGFCYIEDLVMENCKLLHTSLAFEYSTVDADIISHVDSVKNPSGGIIRARSIGEIILEPDKIDPAKTKILCEE